ncbi:MAG: helix-turn-helix transcriptional regulator [Gammaproteobacteria bacterium]
MITETETPVNCNVVSFASLYRITTADARVLQQLTYRHNPREIVKNLHVSMKTLRTQLSAIFAKTNTRNQRDLTTTR